jgi:hypothetical protein
MNDYMSKLILERGVAFPRRGVVPPFSWEGCSGPSTAKL